VGIGWTCRAAGDEDKPRQLPTVPRVEESVDLAAITRAADFAAFMERRSFPLPAVPLARFSARTVAERPFVTAVYRLDGAQFAAFLFADYREQLAVNQNLEASPENRWTVYKVTPLANNRTGSAALLYTDRPAGYSLQYSFHGDFGRDQTTVTVTLKPCTP
jgi:hypothetical protein